MAFNNATNSTATWTPNFIVEGLTTVVWGTEALYAGYIVVDANEEPRVDLIEIEQGAGFEAIVVLLKKGTNVELNCIDDTNQTPPAVGTIINLLNEFGASVPMLVVNGGATQARKREGMRKITARSYNAIAGLH